VISISGVKFINWTRAAGGGGAIDLAMHWNDAGFKDAVNWLERHFPLPDGFPSLTPPPRVLKLPPPDASRLYAVKRYLVDDRAITPSVLDSLIESGTLYADRRGNAVFLLLGQENTPVGAELRGTGSVQWRAMATGSQKDLGYFAIHALDAMMLILCESAIDAISCSLLHPSTLCISTSGARPNPRFACGLVWQTYRLLRL
jgi:hypothetical protein